MDPRREQLTDRQALQFVKETLGVKSPRIIKKCLSDANFFYQTFRTADGVKREESTIRLADVLVLSYLKMEWYELFEFIRNRIAMAFDTMEKLDPASLREFFGLKESLKDKKFKLVEWIQEELSMTGHDINLLPHADFLEELFALSLRRFYEIAYGHNDRADAPSSGNIFNTTSDPYVLLDYLQFVDNQNMGGVTANAKIFRNHKENKTALDNLNNTQLIQYSRWLRTLRDAEPKLHLDVARQLRTKVWNDAATLAKYQLFDTLRHEAAMQLSFQLLEVFEKTIKANDSSDRKDAKILLHDFWLSGNVDSGSKLSVCNSFCNKEHNSDINFRLNRAFDMVFDDELKVAVNFLFEEINNKYFEKKDDIFENEENAFFVIYQNWSGNPANEQEIGNIHGLIKQHLPKHVEAIELFWKEFPFKESWSNWNIEEVVDDADFHSRSIWPNALGRELFVSLEDLSQITTQDKIKDDEVRRKVNFWATYVRHPLIKEKMKVRSDRTLRSKLTSEGRLSTLSV